MTPAATAVAARMGTRAGEAWRTARSPVRNPFRHPALHILAAQWRGAFIAAALPDRPPSRRRRPH